jgi:hypothetical protein
MKNDRHTLKFYAASNYASWAEAEECGAVREINVYDSFVDLKTGLPADLIEAICIAADMLEHQAPVAFRLYKNDTVLDESIHAHYR